MSEVTVPRQPPSPTGAGCIHLTDFAEVSSFFSSWQGQFDQLSRGRFAGTLQVVRGRVVRIVRIECNQRVSLRGRDAAGLFSVYPVIAGNAASMWQGLRLTPGHLVLPGTDEETDHCSGRQTDGLGVSLHPAALEEAARVLLKSEHTSLSRDWAVLSPPPEAFSSLNFQVTRLLTAGVADPSLLGTPEGHGFEQECIRSLVASLFPKPAPGPEVSLPARSRLIRRAEEFMRARLGDPVSVIDLCRELGASDRTLRFAFSERYGLGPIAYFKCLRLNAVRSRLKANPHITIADAAREFGFHHLGNFAADYRRMFGERPSETERRR
jgi:AraC family transcriptional regulator, ethanolamine operon transcriptional activator